MSLKTGAKNKMWIKHNGTGEVRSVQFNPTELEYNRPIEWTPHSAPGQPYPNHQFSHGTARTFTLDLYMYGMLPGGYSDDSIVKLSAWLGSNFLTPENNVWGFTRPADFTLCFGYFIRKCVLDDLNIRILRMDVNGDPTEAILTLYVRQVGTDV